MGHAVPAQQAGGRAQARHEPCYMCRASPPCRGGPQCRVDPRARPRNGSKPSKFSFFFQNFRICNKNLDCFHFRVHTISYIHSNSMQLGISI
jgi:hypothetical protein